MIKLPVTDGDGFPIQTRGVSAFPGLFFVGLPWLHTAKSGLIFGVSEDARYIADRISARREAAGDEHVTAIVPLQGASLKPKRSPATSRWADRMMTLIWSSALSLALDGFATYATGIYPTAPRDQPQQTQGHNATAAMTAQQAS